MGESPLPFEVAAECGVHVPWWVSSSSTVSSARHPATGRGVPEREAIAISGEAATCSEAGGRCWQHTGRTLDLEFILLC